MFNILHKEKIISYLCKIHSWQKNDFDNISFELKKYNYPIYLLSINDLFNDNNIEETPEILYIKDSIEKDIYSALKMLDLSKIMKNNIDFTLETSRITHEKTDFTLLGDNEEIYCILNNNGDYQMHLVMNNSKKIDLDLLNKIRKTIYILSLNDVFSSK